MIIEAQVGRGKTYYTAVHVDGGEAGERGREQGCSAA